MTNKPGTNKTIIRFLSVLLVAQWLLIHSLSAQQYYFDNYSVQQNISSEVFTILKDRQDFIWLGTPDGLTRFDGFDFQHYNAEDDGLSPGSVKTLIQDSRGIIWAGHYSGNITKFDGRNFYSIKTPATEANQDIWSLAEGRDGSIWIGTMGSGVMHLVNPDDNIEDLDFIVHKGGKVGDLVPNISMVNDTLYFLTTFGIRTFDPATESFIPHNIQGINYAHKYAMIGDHEGNHWYGTMNDGLLKYNPQTKELTGFDIRDGLVTNAIYNIMEDSQGNIWTINMTPQYDHGGLTKISDSEIKGFDSRNGLPSNMLHSLEEDREGNILIGTKRNGLFIFKGEQFITIPKQDPDQQIKGLADPQVFDILQDHQNRFWFATDNGITIYDPQAQEENKYNHLMPSSHGIHKSVRNLKMDSQSNIWIGTEGGGVFRYVSSTGEMQVSSILTHMKYHRDNIVTAMDIDASDNLWVGTHDGLAFYSAQKKADERLSQLHGLSGNDISAIYVDQDQKVWIGCLKEGICISTEPKKFKALHFLTEATVNCFLQGDAKNMWVGTTNGLYKVNEDTIIDRYTTDDGLLNNTINLLNKDEEGNIYIGTNFGLNRFDPKENRFFTYTEKNGFVGRETKPNATHLDHNGNVWFGTANGATRFNPALTPDSFPQPIIYLTQTLVNQEDQNLFNGIKLRHNEDNLTFNYTSINLTNPDAVRFTFMLEGLNEEWQQPTKERMAKYQALSPGKYTFMVRAKNHYGIWSNPERISFTIKPPFYQTWWFILICAVVGVTVVYTYIKIRERNLIREKRILEDRVNERTIELSNANAELAMKNKDITDSIHYARRIQFAILPPEIPYDDTFVLFKPKDIVSGDFYWINNRDHKEFIAAVDCTGHGVPGAFMSFIGYTSLNKIILEKGITQPAEVLDQLNNEVVHALHQQGDDNQVKDGMDMSLICYNKKENTLQFAGAYNGIYLIRNGEFIEYKGDRFAIGRSVVEKVKDFTHHHIELQPGDVIYQYSDGYADQFGGPEGKKFRAKPFKKLLTDIHQKPFEEQREILDKTIEEWRGNQEQIDDILVIGRKF